MNENYGKTQSYQANPTIVLSVDRGSTTVTPNSNPSVQVYRARRYKTEN